MAHSKHIISGIKSRKLLFLVFSLTLLAVYFYFNLFVFNEGGGSVENVATVTFPEVRPVSQPGVDLDGLPGLFSRFFQTLSGLF